MIEATIKVKNAILIITTQKNSTDTHEWATFKTNGFQVSIAKALHDDGAYIKYNSTSILCLLSEKGVASTAFKNRELAVKTAIAIKEAMEMYNKKETLDF